MTICMGDNKTEISSHTDEIKGRTQIVFSFEVQRSVPTDEECRCRTSHPIDDAWEFAHHHEFFIMFRENLS